MGKDSNGKPKLTAKQAAFVRHYLLSFNATQAAIKAGYSKKTAKEIGTENLSKPSIRAALADKLEKFEKKSEEQFEVTRDKIIAEFAKMGFAEENTKLKKGALDSLARINGMFDDRLRQTVVDDDIIAKLAIDMGVTIEEARRRYEDARAKYEK